MSDVKIKSRKFVLGIYNLLLAGFAIWDGILMVSATQVFSSYPSDWLGKLPFDSWMPYGVIAIVVFGLGNLLAAMLCLVNKLRIAAIWSGILGILLCAIMLGTFVITGHTYMPGNMMLIAGALQLVLSVLMLASKHANS